MIKYFSYWILLLSVVACNDNSKSTEKNDIGNRTVIPPDSASHIAFDSSSLEGIINRYHYNDSIVTRLKKFYSSRDYQFAWFRESNLAEQGFNFWNAQASYIAYTGDSSLYNPSLQQLMDTLSHESVLDDSNKLNTEVELSAQFFRYARRAYQGNIRLGEHELDWFIPRKRIDMLNLLDSLIKHKGENMAAYEPVNRQYQLLKDKLLEYYKLAENGGWPEIDKKIKTLKKGDSSLPVHALKTRLHTTGDYNSSDTNWLFTAELEMAVKNFQRRYGLKEDGVVGGNTLQHLNQPVEILIRQILVNMERMRWIPEEPEGDFMLVNIPQYRLIVYEKGKRMFAMNIVAGSSQNQTVIFTGDLKYVVFSPYWNIPPSIIRKEILPGIKRDKNYLAKHNMEWNKGAVRQKPGPNNSLGKVKFLFPNNYNIYLHDTPAKSLFDEPKRAFSHGCIRLADPKKLAMWALRNQPEWTENRINKAMNSGKEKFVKVNATIPVVLGYFTAWVDEEGKINFRDDIYGHDIKLAEHLFNKVD